MDYKENKDVVTIDKKLCTRKELDYEATAIAIASEFR